MSSVEDIMKRTASLPLSVAEIEVGARIIEAANPAPWKVTRSDADEWGADWQIASMGTTQGTGGSPVDIYLNTDGISASHLCGDAESDANAIAWLRNNARALILTAKAAHKFAGGAA